MNGFLNDLRFGLRQLATKPGFAAAAIITLALGIGANTAVFSVLNGYLLKPLPYPHGDKLVDISESFPGAHADIVGVSVMNYREFKRDLVALAGIAAYARKDYNLTVDGRTQRITALRARSALFDVLEAKPYLGHVFNRANDQQGRGNVAVLSYGFWQQTFGGDRSVIGRSIKLDGRPYRIIGVMPRGWNFPDKRASLFVPYVFTPFLLHLTRESGFPFHVIGRTKRGASIHTVAMELAQFKSRVEREASASLQAVYKKYHWQLNVLPYKHIAVGDRAPLLWILQGFVLLVLLMACANVANLLLARILGRSHEIAMRAALGASRVALVRQQFAEGLCVAIPGGVIGVAIGWLAVTFIDRAGIGEQLALFDLSPDWRVGLFALGVVIAVAIGISVLPIRQLSRNDLQSLLQASGRTAGSSHSARRMRNGLVVAEIALAAALLGGTGLLVNSFLRLQSVHPGFDPERVITADVLLPRDMNDSARYYQQLLQHVRALPAVTQAGLVSTAPVKASPRRRAYSVPGFSPVGARQPIGNLEVASPGYFKAMGIPLLRGRFFGSRAMHSGRPAVIIDQKLADLWFPHTDPIGHQITVGGYNDQSGHPMRLTIVGEVASVRAASLDRAPQRGTFYLNVLQLNEQLLPATDMTVAVKTTLPPYALTQSLRQVVHDVNPLVSISDFTSMDDVLFASLAEREFVMGLVLLFAAIGLALAAVGVYGVLSYMVGQRQAECGVRLALGALPNDLLRLILRDGLRMLALGLCIGLGLAVVLGYAISSRLFNVTPFDPLTLIGVMIALSIITLLACWIPAHRASKLDPAVAMTEQ